MPTIFGTTGKGRKQCLVCNKFVGARVFVCQCGSKFKARGIVKRVSNFYNTPGKGRKQCLGCKKYVGARHLGPCPNCKYNIKKGELAPRISEYEQETPKDIRYLAAVCGFTRAYIVTAPSGSCPIDKPELKQNRVSDFCELLQNYGLKTKRFYTPEAIKYFGRHHLFDTSKEVEIFGKMVDIWVKNRISV